MLAVSWPAALTVNIAALLVTAPVELFTFTVNCEPLSASVATGVVYVEEVAPLMADPFLLHW